jgi:Tfp pilus assembly protein PilV
MSMVEAIILMLVLGISIWAIMSTAVWSTQLHNFARNDLNARMLAASWFEVFECIDPEPEDLSFTMASATNTVAKILDPSATGSYTNPNGFTIQGFRVIVDDPATNTTMGPTPVNGVRTVKLKIKTRHTGLEDFTIEKRINAKSSKTVPDDRYGGDV